MNYENFMEQVIEHVSLQMGDEVSVRIVQVKKNNSIYLDGLTILRTGENVSPTIYLNSFYDAFLNGMSMEQIVSKIMKIYLENRYFSRIDPIFFTDYEMAKDKIVMRIIHYRKNRELLSEVPHHRFLNLAVICYYQMEHEHLEHASILVRREHMKKWNVTKEQLFRQAYANTKRLNPGIVYDMNMLLEEYTDMKIPPEVAEDIPLWVLTNADQHYGAIWMTDRRMLAELADKLDSDLYLLPASVHECIICPKKEEKDVYELLQMVMEVNHVHVAPEEVLADSVYFYDRRKEELTIAASDEPEEGMKAIWEEWN